MTLHWLRRQWHKLRRGNSSSAPRQPSLAREARDALRRHVLDPLLPRIIDQEYGGFLVDFDDQWNASGPQHKSLEHAVRTTRAFALLHEAFPRDGYGRFVRHGCAFMCDAMWDHAHGGFFARVDRGGQPLWDGLKHPHAVTYAAETFLLAEPHLPPGEGAAWAERTFDWLENVSWDPVHGGYWGSFRRNNDRYAPGSILPTPDGKDVFGLTPGFKEINTQGDAIEMLTRFQQRRPDTRRAARLQSLVDLVTGRLLQPGGVLPYRYLPDWRTSPDLVRVGYQFLMARHLLAAVARTEAPSVVAAASALTDFCLRWARHPAGGFCVAVTSDGRSWPATGPASDDRQWWVQIEAVYTLHELAGHRSVDSASRVRYLQARDDQWAYLRTNFFDELHGGIRELPWNPNSTSQPQPLPYKTHCWKDPGHEVGLFLALAADTVYHAG